MSDEDRLQIPRALMELVQQFESPQLTESALNQRFGPRRTWTVTPGQLWRVKAHQITALVLVLKVELTRVQVCAASFDPVAENEESLVVDPQATPFSQPLTLWGNVQRWVPVTAFDRPIFDLGSQVAEWFRCEGATPPNCRRGVNPPSIFSDDHAIQAMKDDELDFIFEHTRLLPPPDKLPYFLNVPQGNYFF